MKKGVKTLYFIIGLIGVVVLFFASDLENANWSIFVSWDFLYFFGILLAIWAVIYAIHTCTFKIILSENKKDIKFSRMYKICVTGFALNNSTPAGVAGGEPYRILELSQFINIEKATATSLTFTAMYLTGHFMIWTTEAILYYCLGCPGDYFSTVLVSIAGIISFIIVLLVVFAKGNHLIEKTFLLLSRFPFFGKYVKKFYENKKLKLQAIDLELANFRKQPKRFAVSMILEYSSRFFEALEYFLIFRFLGTNIPPVAAIMILSNASLIGNILFFIPMQVGSRESGVHFALSWFTQDSSTLAPAYIVYRVRDIFCTLVGVLWMLIEKKRCEDK